MGPADPGLWVQLTLAGAASCSLAAPALAVDRKVGAGPFQALSVSAMHGRARPDGSPPSPVASHHVRSVASVAGVSQALVSVRRPAQEKG